MFTDKLITLDNRVLLRVYAAISACVGTMLVGWGSERSVFLILGMPFGGTALARIVGAVLVAVACGAAALSELEDPRVRSRGVLWFAGGHVFVLLVLYSQRLTILAPALLDHAEQFLAVLAMCAFLAWAGPRFSGQTRPASLRTAVGAHEPLRSRYEQQIREAGAQEERNRLARDLHDSIKQQIFVIQTAAATAQTRFDTDHNGAVTALDQIRCSARDAMAEMEAMMDQLRSVPLANASLIEALKKQCEALGHRTGAHVEFKLGDLPPNDTLLPGSHQAILRVAQEALANIGRHARAKNVTVALDSFSDRLVLRIQDDGAGFDPFEGRRGMGITNMRERAEEFGGKLDLTSSRASGTTVTLSLPHDELPAEGYRKRTILYSAALISLCVLGLRFHASTWIFPTAMCAGELTRNAHDWLRARRYAEAKA